MPHCLQKSGKWIWQSKIFKPRWRIWVWIPFCIIKSKTIPKLILLVVPVQDVKTGIDISGKIDSDEKGFEQGEYWSSWARFTLMPTGIACPSSEKPVQTEFYARTDAKGAINLPTWRRKEIIACCPSGPVLNLAFLKAGQPSLRSGIWL